MSRENWKLEKDLCRCCLSEGSFKNLAEPCFNQGEEEVYCEMLLESLDINLVPVSGPLCSSTYTICEECILRLREACSFRRQVLLSEKRFRDLYKRDIIELHLKEEAPDSDNEGLVKFEVPKNEDDDFQMNYDDDDDDNKSTIEIEVPQAKKPKPKKPKAKEKPKQPKKRTGRPRKVETKTEAEAKAEAEAKVEAEAGAEAETVKHKGNVADYYTVRDGRYYCNPCELSYASQALVSQHIRFVHFKRRPKARKCPHCIEKIPDNLRTKHFEEAHGIQPPTCGICQKKLSSPQAVQEHHKRIHIAGKTGTRQIEADYYTVRDDRYYCNSCERSFAAQALVSQHYRYVHLKRRPKARKCPHCTEEIPYHLQKKHLEQAHGIELPTCEVCHKKFSYPRQLLQHHRRVHMAVKTVTCNICNKGCFNQLALKNHMITHGNKERFQCDWCSQKFRWKHTLKIHIMTHMGVRNFVCAECGQAFVQKYVLQNHIQRMHKELYLKCHVTCSTRASSCLS